MILTKLVSPIAVFNIADWKVNLKRFVENVSAHYPVYAWDNYLLRQNQIEFFKRHLTQAVQESLDNRFWVDYYMGKIGEEKVQELLTLVPEALIPKFWDIKATRKRLIAEYNLTSTAGDWEMERIPARAFGQEYALTNDANSPDYRLGKRVFKEIPDSLDCADLKLILKGLAQELQEKNPEIFFLNIIVHHTLVYCYSDQPATNSPEGIHQDGMDYIVSALVVERNNINGGKSIVYGSDIKTKIMETILQSGQGILQPDKNTELWHEVTPICCEDSTKLGYRSTIGFDITVNCPG